MKSKQLIYKATYENISIVKEIPDLSIEDIREILLEKVYVKTLELDPNNSKIK